MLFSPTSDHQDLSWYERPLPLLLNQSQTAYTHILCLFNQVCGQKNMTMTNHFDSSQTQKLL